MYVKYYAIYLNMNKWLIIYDISNPKRLQRVARKMKSYATRVQKSVFEMEAPQKTLDKLRNEILKIIDDEKDYVVYFSICEPDWQKRVKYGPQKFEEEEEKPYYIY